MFLILLSTCCLCFPDLPAIFLGFWNRHVVLSSQNFILSVIPQSTTCRYTRNLVCLCVLLPVAMRGQVSCILRACFGQFADGQVFNCASDQGTNYL